MPIRAITFDFWMTLFREDGLSEQRRNRRIEAFCAATGVPEVAAAEAQELAVREFSRVHIEEQRNLGPSDGVRLMCDACDVQVDEETAARLAEVFATAILHFPPVPVEDALEAVRLAAEQYPVALICDSGMSPGRSLRVLLERHGFTPYFQTLVFSDEVGVSKPQALMYETAAKGMGVSPHELFHIGDLEKTDIAGALGVKARAALFVGVNDKYLHETKAPVAYRRWREFMESLPQLEQAL